MTPTQEALSGFLDAIDFELFCTFTTRKPTSVAGCRRIAETVAKRIDAGGRSTMFWAAEPFDAKGGEKTHLRFADHGEGLSLDASGRPIINTRRYHFHALMTIRPAHWMTPIDLYSWYFPRYGRCQIINNTDPDRRQAASVYMTKYCTKGMADYDIYLPKNLLQ